MVPTGGGTTYLCGRDRRSGGRPTLCRHVAGVSVEADAAVRGATVHHTSGAPGTPRRRITPRSATGPLGSAAMTECRCFTGNMPTALPRIDAVSTGREAASSGRTWVRDHGARRTGRRGGIVPDVGTEKSLPRVRRSRRARMCVVYGQPAARSSGGRRRRRRTEPVELVRRADGESCEQRRGNTAAASAARHGLVRRSGGVVESSWSADSRSVLRSSPPCMIIPP